MKKLILIIVFFEVVSSCKKHHQEPTLSSGENIPTQITKVVIVGNAKNGEHVTYTPYYNSNGNIDSISILVTGTIGGNISMNYVTKFIYENGNLMKRTRDDGSTESYTYDNNNRVSTYEDSVSIPDTTYIFEYGNTGQLDSVISSASAFSLIITDSSAIDRTIRATVPYKTHTDPNKYYNLKINPDNSFSYSYGQINKPNQIVTIGQYSQLRNTIPSILWNEITQTPNGLSYTTGYLDIVFRDIEPRYFIVSLLSSGTQVVTNSYSYSYTTDPYGRIQTIVENANGIVSNRTFTFYY